MKPSSYPTLIGVLSLALRIQKTRAEISFVQAAAQDMVTTLIAPGSGTSVASDSVFFEGDPLCAGTYSNGNDAVPGADFPNDGVVISTGDPTKLPNQDENATTTSFGQPGDEDLQSQFPPNATYDACGFGFSFECPQNYNFVTMKYVLGSDEYNEWVDEQYNDVFALFLNGDDIAFVPGTNEHVGIDTINANSSSQFFRNNDMGEFPNFEADGFTVTLRASARIAPYGSSNTMKIVIADRGDSAIDSWLFLEKDSFQCFQNLEPYAVCEDIVVPAGAGCRTTVAAKDIASKSSDPESDQLTFFFKDLGGDTFSFSLGLTAVTILVTDGLNTQSCDATVLVEDNEAISMNATSCGATGVMSTNDVPAVYIPSYTKANGCPVEIQISQYTCRYCDGGVTTDRLAAGTCLVDANASALTVYDSGGAASFISFDVNICDRFSTDCATYTCTICTSDGAAATQSVAAMTAATSTYAPATSPPGVAYGATSAMGNVSSIGYNGFGAGKSGKLGGSAKSGKIGSTITLANGTTVQAGKGGTKSKKDQGIKQRLPLYACPSTWNPLMNSYTCLDVVN